VKSADDLGSILGSLQPGDEVPVIVNRGGQEQTFTVTLGARPMPTQMP
jgi:S1-C subfamily serine protease